MSNDKLVSALLCLLLLLVLSVPAPASESEEELVLGRDVGRDVVAYVAQIILLSPPPPLTDSRERARASFGSQGKIWYKWKVAK
jgi:hypothetical protein